MENQFSPTFEKLLSREEIIASVIRNWTPERVIEQIPVTEALGRIPSAKVCSVWTLPVVRSSAGDGIAVDSSRFAQGIPDTSGWIQGRDFVHADTGDDFDDAFDAVIMVENIAFSPEGRLTIRDGVQVYPGYNVRPAGSIVQKGEALVRANLPLRPRDLACLQMGGVGQISVWKKPVVAFIPSGSELIAPGTPVTRGKNVDTNSLLVRETIKQLGAEPLCLPIVPDDYEPILEALDSALIKADIIILGGGSSKGAEDFSATLLHQRGKVLCHGAQAVPGKPLCVAMIQGKPVINLPGPFMAAYHGLEWLVNALVSHFLMQPKQARQTVKATLTQPVEGSERLSMLLVVEVSRKRDGSGYWATPYNFKKIPMSRTVAANGQYMTKLGESLPAGSEIEVELLRGPAYIPDAGWD